MSSPFRRRALLTAALAASLSSCTVGPTFAPPNAATPAGWSDAAATAGAPGQVTVGPTDAASWWTLFGDTELNSLVERAAAANLDAKAAVLRVTQARAQRDIAAADRGPNLTVNASGQVNRLSESTPTGALFSKIGAFPGVKGVSIPNPYDQYQLGVSASWELDLFGRVRRSVEAADADTQAQVEDSRAVQVAVLGDVGHAYFDLRGVQAERGEVAATIATEKDLLDLAAQRRRAGLSSEIDVSRAAAELSGAEAGLPTLDAQIARDINALSQLLALEPGALRAELSAPAPPPTLPTAAPIGLPADLARRRPDIREAEARLHAATARVGVAVAGLYPEITLNAGGGYQAQDLSQLTRWASRFVNAGPELDLPVFDSGRRRATLRLQDAAAKAAALDYQRTVLGALVEVDDDLATYGGDQARLAALDQTVARDREAAQLAGSRYASGVADDITVLDADRALQQAEVSSAQGRAAVYADLVAVYRALGGGWR